MTFDFQGSLTKEYISILAVFYLIFLIQRYRTPPFYNRSVYDFISVSDVCLTWVTIVAVIHAFLDFDGVDNIGLLYLFIGLPFVAFAY